MMKPEMETKSVLVELFMIPQAACDSGKANWEQVAKMFKKQLDMKIKETTVTETVNNPGGDNTKKGNLISRLKDPDEATFLLVAYPEFTPLHESYSAMKDLERVGIKAQGIFLNNILNEEDCPDDFSKERWKLQQYYLHKAGEMDQPKPLFAIIKFSN